MVGIVVTTSPSLSLYSKVVLPNDKVVSIPQVLLYRMHLNQGSDLGRHDLGIVWTEKQL